jgi:PAS domain S-box-containing protein
VSKKQSLPVISPSKDNLSGDVNMLVEVLNNVGTCIFTKDVHGCYTYVNQAVLDLLNVNSTDIIGFDDSHFFDLALSEQLKENDRKVIQEAITVENVETNFIKSLQETRIYKTVKKPLFDDSKNVIGICGVSTDITAEKNLQKMVSVHKKLLHTVLDNVDAYIYMKDSERTFKYVNSKVAELFGMPAENIIGKKDTEVLPLDVAEHFNQSDQKVLIRAKNKP